MPNDNGALFWGPLCELEPAVQLDVRRGVAKLGHNGEVKILLDDYPYAEDGLLIWNALKKWNDGYLVGLNLAKDLPDCGAVCPASVSEAVLHLVMMFRDSSACSG